jgi:hypothetical protein
MREISSLPLLSPLGYASFGFSLAFLFVSLVMVLAIDLLLGFCDTLDVQIKSINHLYRTTHVHHNIIINLFLLAKCCQKCKIKT